MPLGTVIQSFSGISTQPRFLAFDGRILWHVDNATLLMYQLDPDTGTPIKSFSVFPGLGGLDWDGVNLIAGDFPSQIITQISPKDGTVISSIPSPSTFPFGVCWDGFRIWVSDRTTDLIYQIDAQTGTIIKSFSSPSTAMTDIMFDGRSLWGLDNTADLGYQFSPQDGTVIQSFAITLGGSPSPHGLTTDGRTIWYCGVNSDLISQLYMN